MHEKIMLAPKFPQGHMTLIVVPCYNEALRLDADAFRAAVARDSQLHFLFTNDGSTDDTLQELYTLCAECPSLSVLHKPKNEGKAAAVRDGLLEGLRSGQYQFIGFWDADLATPLDAIGHLRNKMLEDANLQMVFGARIRLLGREIHRKSTRHYLGRLFATSVSIMLQLPVYDTQCGAKLFKTSPQLAALLQRPFLTRWIFDVEIVARYIQQSGRLVASQSIYEYPLHVWRDIDGSKVRPADFLRALIDVLKIRKMYPLPKDSSAT